MSVQEMAVAGNMSRVKKFLREVRAELKKVSWPSKQELTSSTGIVFVSVVAVAVMIWLIDAMFTGVLRAIIK